MILGSENLMIGNWVYKRIILSDRIIRKLYQIESGEDIDRADGDEEYEGIMLTEEILDRLFPKTENTWSRCYHINDDYMIELYSDNTSQLVATYDDSEISAHGLAFICELNYVHVLQNALKLLGIEKKIKL